MTGLHDRRRLSWNQRWPGVCADKLGSRWQVVEEGLPGRTTVHPDPISGAYKDGILGLEIALETHLPITVVAMMLGTNDLQTRFAVTATDIALSIERLIKIVKSSDTGMNGTAPEVLLIAPPPILEVGCFAEQFQGGAAKSQQLANLYLGIADAMDCRFLDAGRFIASSPIDGLHFDEANHEALGLAIAEFVSTNFLENDHGH